MVGCRGISNCGLCRLIFSRLDSHHILFITWLFIYLSINFFYPKVLLFTDLQNTVKLHRQCWQFLLVLFDVMRFTYLRYFFNKNVTLSGANVNRNLVILFAYFLYGTLFCLCLVKVALKVRYPTWYQDIFHEIFFWGSLLGTWIY